MHHDVIIVGGSFAGLSAAMQLARGRRDVLVIDAGKPRNRFSATAHGFFGHDGKTPAALVAEAAAQVLAYPSAAIVHAEAVGAEALDDGFAVSLADGGRHTGRRLILASGITDVLPDVTGLAQRWGRTVLHCPYCHGFEFAGRQLGVLANHALSTHQGMMIPDWGPTTFFTQGRFEPEAADAAAFETRGTRIERTPVVELLGSAPALEAVRLADGRVIEMAALFTAPHTRLASPLAAQLGCELVEGPLGAFVKVDDLKQTSVKGVFAAGDAAAGMHSATFASAAGAMAGVAAHRSIIFERAAA